MDFAVRHTFLPVFEGDNITETFKSVDSDVIVSELNELRNHVLYRYMSFNDSVVYW